MKKILILSIDFYQKIVSPLIKQLVGVNSSCRFNPTCSEYVKTSIKEKGVVLGIYKGLVRLSRCQPFYTSPKVLVRKGGLS